MHIQVKILTMQARAALRQLQAQLVQFRSAVNATKGGGVTGGFDKTGAAASRMGTQMAAANAQSKKLQSSFSRTMNATTALGNQLQWTGRQLQFNFALPLALVGGYAVKSALQQEQAMVRVRKVYGSGEKGAQFYAKEVKALERNFTALSNTFGVHREQVTQIAGDWAAAGASGVALARGVKLTLQTMVLGELEAVEATKALIAIQAQYGVDTKELTRIIADMNMIENETGASMGDLIDAMARSASVARSVGVGHRELGAIISLLVPAAGSAVTAGNGLKTMLTRIMAPTNAAADAMEAMGIKVYDASWQNLTATERMTAMAKGFNDLTAGQRIFISDLVAGKWQLAKWSQIMATINNEQGYFQKAMDATSDPIATMKQMQTELNTVLASSPQKLKSVAMVIKNSLADAIVPLLPYIVAIGQKIADWTRAFSTMNPYMQGAVVAVAGFLLVVGPLLRYMGASVALFGVMGSGLHKIGGAALAAARFLGLIGPAAAAGQATATAATAAGTTAQVGLFARAHAAMATVTTTGLTGMFARWVIFWKTLLGMQTAASAKMVATQTATAGAMGKVGFLAKLRHPLVIAIGAMLMLLWGFRHQVVDVFQSIGQKIGEAFSGVPNFFWRVVAAISEAFWALPKSVRDAMLAVVNLVMSAASAIADLFRNLNPFGNNPPRRNLGSEHRGYASGGFVSGPGGPTGDKIPALLSNGEFVIKASKVRELGVTALNKLNEGKSKGEFGFAAGGVVQASAGRLAAFEKAAAAFTGGGLGDERKVVSVELPKMLPQFDKLIADMRTLNSLAMQQAAAVKGQEAVVKRWETSLKSANDQLNQQQDILSGLQENLSALETQYAAHEQRLQDYATAPLVGMGQMNDAIFANEMAQKKLRLEIARMEQANTGVNQYEAALKKASRALEEQQRSLDGVRDSLTALQDRYSQHEQALRDYASAPLNGMGAVSDKIFENELAQKKLRLEMLKWEQVNGSIDSVRDRLAMLQGDLEQAQGEASNLRQLGAGSDVLAPIMSEISAIEAQYAATADAVKNSPIAELQKEMDKLKLEGEIMQLEQEINFDPMLREIDKLAKAQKEMSYEEIVSGINRERAAMEALEPQIDAATEAVKRQEEAVKSAQAAHDSIQDSYEREKEALEALLAPMQAALEQLQLTGEILQLEYDLKFEPLVREIEQLANAQKELSYEEIIAGINRERAAMEALEPKIAAATAAVNAQEDAVKRVQAARDAIQDTYDQEKDKLDVLNESYRETEGLIRDIESALNGVASQAKAIESAKKTAKDAGSMSAQEKFDAAGAADFPDIGGTAGIGREGGDADQAFDIDELTRQLIEDQAKLWGSFDFFKPIRDAWDKGVGWFKSAFSTFFTTIGNDLRAGWKFLFSGDSIDTSGILQPIQNAFWSVIDFLSGVKDDLAAKASEIWNSLFADNVGQLWTDIKTAWSEGIQGLKDELSKWVPSFHQTWSDGLNGLTSIFSGIWTGLKTVMSAAWEVLGDDIEMAWSVIKASVETSVNVIVGVVSIAFSALAGVVKPALDLVFNTFEAFFKIARGALEFFVGVFQGDFKKMGDGLLTIVTGMWDMIYGAFKGAWQILSGFIKGLVDGVINFFKYLYNVLVGNSIVPDMIDEIIEVFKKLAMLGAWIYTNVVKPISDWFSKLWHSYVAPMVHTLVNGVKSIFTGLAMLGGWVMTNVVKPVSDWFSKMWYTYVAPMTHILVNGVMGIFRGLAAIGGWLYANVVKPTSDAFASLWGTYIKPVMNALIRGVAGVFNAVGRAISEGVNIGIKALNLLIDGLNWIGNNVPGLKFSVTKITEHKFTPWTPPQFATGGVMPARVGAGFATNKARAIVGEGGSYPEYVIPTDPQHRNNAMKLYEELGAQLKTRQKVDPEATGGWGPVGNAWDAVKDAASTVWGAIQDKVGATWDALKSGGLKLVMKAPELAFNGMAGLLPKSGIPGIVRQLVIAAKDRMMQWAGNSDNVWMAGQGGGGAWGAGSGIGPAPSGGALGWARMWQIVKTAFPDANFHSGYRAGAITATGNPSYHGMGRALDTSPRMDIFKWIAANYGSKTKELIFSPAGNKQIHNGRNYNYPNPKTRADHWDHIHWAYDNGGLLQPGISRMFNGTGKPEPVLTSQQWSNIATLAKRGAEVQTDKIFYRLDRLERKISALSMGGGDVIININGNLEFPNISNGGDAREFVRNLEIMSRG